MYKQLGFVSNHNSLYVLLIFDKTFLKQTEMVGSNVYINVFCHPHWNFKYFTNESHIFTAI